ncbi:MAG: Ger(x)C family spore germination C-terminal domain-containing protein [Christensenellales bacterium]
MLKNKTLLIGIMIVFLIVFDYLVPGVDISKRSIVVGIALGQEDSRLCLSVQTLTRNKGENAQYEVNSVLCDDVISGIDDLGLTVGGQLSLAHTLVIIVEDNALAISALDYVAKGNLVSDRTYIVAASHSAKEIISANAGGKESVSSVLRESQEIAKTRAGILPCNVRKYLAESAGVGSCVSLPVVALQDDALDITSSLVIKDGRPVMRLDNDACVGISLVEGKIFNSKMYVSSLDESMEIISCKLNFSMSGDTINLRLNMSTKAFGAKGLTDQQKSAIEKQATEQVIHAFHEGISSDCDVLHLGQRIKAFYPQKWQEIVFVKDCTLQVEVSFT